MGEKPNRVKADSPANRVRELETEIAESRRRLDGYVAELDQRRHHGWGLPEGLARVLFVSAVGFAFGGAVRALFRRR